MNPKVGMGYADVSRRIKRIQSNPGHPQAKTNLINSLKNQCRIAEGEPAMKELERECALTKTGSFLTGSGNKQMGIGPGQRLGTGRYRYIDGKWFCVDH